MAQGLAKLEGTVPPKDLVWAPGNGSDYSLNSIMRTVRKNTPSTNKPFLEAVRFIMTFYTDATIRAGEAANIILITKTLMDKDVVHAMEPTKETVSAAIAKMVNAGKHYEALQLFEIVKPVTELRALFVPHVDTVGKAIIKESTHYYSEHSDTGGINLIKAIEPYPEFKAALQAFVTPYFTELVKGEEQYVNLGSLQNAGRFLEVAIGNPDIMEQVPQTALRTLAIHIARQASKAEITGRDNHADNRQGTMALDLSIKFLRLAQQNKAIEQALPTGFSFVVMNQFLNIERKGLGAVSYYGRTMKHVPDLAMAVKDTPQLHGVERAINYNLTHKEDDKRKSINALVWMGEIVDAFRQASCPVMVAPHIAANTIETYMREATPHTSFDIILSFERNTTISGAEKFAAVVAPTINVAPLQTALSYGESIIVNVEAKQAKNDAYDARYRREMSALISSLRHG